MKLEFVTYENLLSGDHCYTMDMIKEIFSEFIDALTSFANDFSDSLLQDFGVKDFKNRILLDEERALQAILEALDDLKRLKDFHPVKNPNRIKYASYLAYWWLQRKPLYVNVDKINLDDDLIQRLINFNEFFLVTYVLNELFNCDELECSCMQQIKNYDDEWVQVQNYLFYFFCYRTNSPKTVEAFLRGSILHPLWKRNKDVGLT